MSSGFHLHTKKRLLQLNNAAGGAEVLQEQQEFAYMANSTII
jgi:hypothetical protein